ncbi:MAG TPA: hypothetical protein VFC16_05520 [Nakamurella sp.]|nr:hypothetical protein [Nakamurella sp.]
MSGRQQVVDRAAAAVLHGHLGRGTPTLGTTRPEVIDGWAEIFRAMADSNRLRILLAAHHSPGIDVTGLADAVGHDGERHLARLAALRVRGMIRSERVGRERRWSSASEQIHSLLHDVGATHPPSA